MSKFQVSEGQGFNGISSLSGTYLSLVIHKTSPAFGVEACDYTTKKFNKEMVRFWKKSTRLDENWMDIASLPEAKESTGTQRRRV